MVELQVLAIWSWKGDTFLLLQLIGSTQCNSHVGPKMCGLWKYIYVLTILPSTVFVQFLGCCNYGSPKVRTDLKQHRRGYLREQLYL